MGTIPCDTSFDRGGRTLAQWLPELVGDERAPRHAAGEALQAMQFAMPSVHTDFEDVDSSTRPDLTEHSNRLNQAIREAVEQPGFPKEDFVRRLMIFRLALDDEWRQKTDQMSYKDPKYDQRETELIERVMLSSDEAERQRAGARFRRVFCASLERDNRISNSAENMQPAGIASYLIMLALDKALLAAADVLEEMLDHSGTRHEALEALARIGPPGQAFAPKLLAELQALQKDYFDAEAALGSVARDDAVVADALVRLLSSGSSQQRTGAMATLEALGPHLGGREAECVELLIGAFEREEDLAWASLSALASVGRTDERALRVVLDAARPRPPRMRAHPAFPEHQYDQVMLVRGAAISALAYFTAFAGQVVPVLTDAKRDFEEFDPDWEQLGDHARINDTLKSLGVDPDTKAQES